MSLVSEALRKARQEAARREAAKRGTLIPAVIVRAGAGARVSVPLVLGAVLAASVGGGALVAWWAGHSQRSPGVATDGRGVEAPPAPAPGEVVAPGVETSGGRAALASPNKREPPPPAAGAAKASALQGPAAASPRDVPPRELQEQPAPAPPAATEAGIQPEPAPEASRGKPAESAKGTRGPHGERTFVIDAHLGYATLHLDYLVYKPGAPFASINGTKVVTGGLVDGFRVEEITPDAIRLSDQHGPLLLRVH